MHSKFGLSASGIKSDKIDHCSKNRINLRRGKNTFKTKTICNHETPSMLDELDLWQFLALLPSQAHGTNGPFSFVRSFIHSFIYLSDVHERYKVQGTIKYGLNIWS